MSRSAHPAGPRHADVLPDVAPSPVPADVNVLDAGVWPATAERRDGVLVIGGRPVTELARDYGTPVFVLDELDLHRRARAYAEGDGTAYYAGKAFLCTRVIEWIERDGLGLDVCTGGELRLALAAGFPPPRIAVHGNNKSLDELTEAVTAGVGLVIVDSETEIDRLAGVAAAAGRRQRVLVRVTVGVEAHTHEYIATAHEDQKFGFSLRGGDAERAVGQVLGHESLEFAGLHSHIGSQIFDLDGFEVAAHRLVGLATTLRDRFGVPVGELNLGGGLGIAYVSDDDPADPQQVLDQLGAIVARECDAADLARPHIAVEPGRAIVGPSAVTLYEIGTVKPVEYGAGVRTYVSVDGGMSDNVRTALYDARYTCVLANRVSTAPPELARVVGKHCESGDIVVRDTWLPADVRPGDLLAVAATGAYCRSMASNYNLVPRPPVVAVRDGRTELLVRRETYDDLFRLDAGYARLTASAVTDG